MSGPSASGPVRAVRFSVIVVDRELAGHEEARHQLAAEPRLRVVGASLSLPAGLQLANALRPDVIVVDSEEPGGDSVRPAELRAAVPDAVIVLFSRLLPPVLPEGVDVGVSKRRAGDLLPALRELLGLLPPVSLAEPCPGCRAVLLVTAVFVEEGSQEVVCVACHRVYRADGRGLVALGVLE